jgi:hypothetical protein
MVASTVVTAARNVTYTRKALITSLLRGQGKSNTLLGGSAAAI